jgi:hypothetical protein
MQWQQRNIKKNIFGSRGKYFAACELRPPMETAVFWLYLLAIQPCAGSTLAGELGKQYIGIVALLMRSLSRPFLQSPSQWGRVLPFASCMRIIRLMRDTDRLVGTAIADWVCPPSRRPHPEEWP